jgi:hypothetical protein
MGEGGAEGGREGGGEIDREKAGGRNEGAAGRGRRAGEGYG